MLRFVVVIAGGVMLAGCATAIRGTSERVDLDTIPTGAEAAVSFTPFCDRACMNRDYPETASKLPATFDVPRKEPPCTTPCSTIIDRTNVLTVTFTKAGYEPRTVVVRPVAGAGSAVVAGNIIVGGTTGMIVDAASGAGHDHCPNPLIAPLRPAGSRASEAPLNTECQSKPIYDVLKHLLVRP